MRNLFKKYVTYRVNHRTFAPQKGEGGVKWNVQLFFTVIYLDISHVWNKKKCFWISANKLKAVKKV